MKKVLIIILSVIVVIFAAVLIFIFATWNKTFDAPTPSLVSNTDSAYIERGKHLVYGPAHCVDCHISPDVRLSGQSIYEAHLIGGLEFDIPPGIFRTPNLTPDPETGIGNFTDGQIARAMRYMVNHEGKYMLPFMPFQNMSDEDLVAVLSFLRSQEPVNNKVEPNTYRFLAKALLAFGALQPQGPDGTPPKSVEPEVSLAYGKYIANSIANCYGCHTSRDLKSGKFNGPDYAGGMTFGPDVLTQGYSFVSPNLTPDEETGIMAKWDENTFINRIRGGRIHKTSPMPWEANQRMDDTELKAIYLYINSVTPVNNKIEKVVYEPGTEK